MIASFAASVLLAVSTATAGLPVAALNTPFPDQGDPIATEAFTEDLLEAEYENGRLPAEALIEIESNPGCFMEEEAAEAWLRLEEHALRDGVEFTASWCYRNMKTQRRTYRRNCPWIVIDPPVEEPDEQEAPPADAPAPEEGDNEEPSDPDAPTDPEAPADPPDEAIEEPVDDVEEPAEVIARVRVCRVPTAKPGNSNHGWGRAVDITAAGALLTCESDAFVWLVENANRYGWVHPGWAACEADKEEAWHWEWGGTANTGPRLNHMGQFTA